MYACLQTALVAANYYTGRLRLKRLSDIDGVAQAGVNMCHGFGAVDSFVLGSIFSAVRGLVWLDV